MNSQLLHQLESANREIADDRKQDLLSLANLVHQELQLNESANMLFVCTHNSRRSQLAEIIIHLLCERAGLPIRSFSAGTEVTAFNPRMVKALESFGIDFQTDALDNQPLYKIDGGKVFFSKQYNDSSIPNDRLIAIMVCDHANEVCPHIPGALHRVSLMYTDPKISDDTDLEEETYRKKVLEIGGEMFFLVQNLVNRRS